MERNLRGVVITLSDRAYKGIYEDKSGDFILNWLKEELKFLKVEKFLIPDEKKFLKKIFKSSLKKGVNLIITTGGTGFGKRDITPEVTEKFIKKKAYGISEYLRLKGLEETPFSVLSRGIAGSNGKTFIINLPGSVKAVQNNLKNLKEILPHLINSLLGIEEHHL